LIAKSCNQLNPHEDSARLAGRIVSAAGEIDGISDGPFLRCGSLEQRDRQIEFMALTVFSKSWLVPTEGAPTLNKRLSLLKDKGVSFSNARGPDYLALLDRGTDPLPA
jgi:hypothetical protein